MHTTQNILRNGRSNLPQACLYFSTCIFITYPFLQGEALQVGRSMLNWEVWCLVLPLFVKT